MRYRITIFILLLSAITYGQGQDSLQFKKLLPEQMNEDLSIYAQLLEETHPGLFRYMSRKEFYDTMAQIESQIEQPLPFYSFYHLLAGLASEIRCAHTTLYPVRDVLRYLQSSCTPFPYFMYPVEDRLYVLFNGTEDQTIKPGFELISINSKSVAEIRRTIEKYQFLDGNPGSVPRRYLQGGYFSLNHYFFVDQSWSYSAVFKDLNGNEVSQIAPGQPYKMIDRNYFRNPVNKEMLAHWNKRQKNWVFEILEEVPSTALIRFGSFGGKGMGSETEAQDAMQDFMNKAMDKMDKKKITNLIIELRGNTGGWDIQGKELFSYLMKSDTAQLYYRNKYAATKESSFLEYSDVTTEDLKRAVAYFIPQEDGSFKLDVAGNSILLPQEPKENRFKGDIYILFNEQCSSSCAEFVAVAKSNKIATLVGSEAGGAYEGGNGSSFINLTLPNSGIYSTTPLLKYEMAVEEATPSGRGTIPDYAIDLTREDILTGNDAQRQFVYQLIKDK